MRVSKIVKFLLEWLSFDCILTQKINVVVLVALHYLRYSFNLMFDVHKY